MNLNFSIRQDWAGVSAPVLPDCTVWMSHLELSIGFLINNWYYNWKHGSGYELSKLRSTW
jgi:hypothetical protein